MGVRRLEGHEGRLAGGAGHRVVVRDSAIMSGAPTFRGTRVLVRTLFDYLEAGHSLERFLEGFPTVRREQASQALEEARESLLANS